MQRAEGEESVVSSPCPSHVRSELGGPVGGGAGSSVCSDGHSDHTGTSSRKRRKYDIKYKGVYACKVSGGNYWQAQISICGNTHHLGVFSTAEEAARAYDEQARALYPRRKVNFPEEDPSAERTMSGTTPAPQATGAASTGQHTSHAAELTSTGAAHSGCFWTGPCWVNDLDDEKVAAFWRGALARGIFDGGPSSPSTSADEAIGTSSDFVAGPLPAQLNFPPAPNKAVWHVMGNGGSSSQQQHSVGRIGHKHKQAQPQPRAHGQRAALYANNVAPPSIQVIRSSSHNSQQLRQLQQAQQRQTLHAALQPAREAPAAAAAESTGLGARASGATPQCYDTGGRSESTAGYP